MDLMNSVDFKKGCFVGQEVVSRMHRKTDVRKRMNAIDCPEPLETGATLLQGEVNVGIVLSAQDNKAMALVRFDRLSDSGEPILAGSVPVTLSKRAYGDQT
jgi:folate-binding Fe-S cluster repair protein YgfZ